MRRTSFLATLLVALGAGSASAQNAAPEALRQIRLMAVYTNRVGVAVEGDFVTWKGLLLLASVQRWPLSVSCPNDAATPPAIEGEPLASKPYCSPEGWGAGAGVRAATRPHGRTRLFVQGELGLYRFDGGGGIVTPLVSGRSGVSIGSRAGARLEIALKAQVMSGFDWRDARYPPQALAALLIGLGVPIG